MAKILIVDDSLTIAKFVENILLQAGHDAAVSVDANDALRRLSLEKYDLILLDVVMPGKNGFQLCREIKATADLAKIPVIIMSTKNTDVDKYWGRKQGADDYLSKPIDADILMAAVNRFVSAPSHSSTPPSQDTHVSNTEAHQKTLAAVSSGAPHTHSTSATEDSPEKKKGFFSRFGFH